MKLTKYSALVLILGLTIVSCKKDDPPPPLPSANAIPVGSLDLGGSVDAGFFGRIVDENNQPLDGVTVTSGVQTVTTDANGVFKIEINGTPSKLAYVKAEKTGYFTSARSMVPVQNAYNYIELMMFSKGPGESFTTGANHTIEIQTGISVTFDGAFIDAANNNYNGSVIGYARYIPAVEHDFDDAQIGAPYGEKANGDEAFMQSYGTILFDVETAAGFPLKFKEEFGATLSMRVDASQLTAAPASVAVCYFDKINGYWVENDNATLSGDTYTGRASNMGSWSFAETHGAAQVTGAYTDYTGDSLANFPIYYETDNGYVLAHSNSNGTYSAILPANSNMNHKVIDDCYSLYDMYPVVPFMEGFNSADIQIPLGTVDILHQTGNLMDCMAQPVSNGYVLVDIGGHIDVQLVQNGAFDVENMNCQSEATFDVSGADLSVSQISIVNQKNLFSPISDAGDVFACDLYTEYLSYSIDAMPLVSYYTGITCAVQDTGGGWFFKIQPADLSLKIIGSVFAPASYIYSANYQPGTIWIRPIDMAEFQSFNITTELVAFGANLGDYVVMNFNGFYTDPLLTVHNISGDLVVRRDN